MQKLKQDFWPSEKPYAIPSATGSTDTQSVKDDSFEQPRDLLGSECNSETEESDIGVETTSRRRLTKVKTEAVTAAVNYNNQ